MKLYPSSFSIIQKADKLTDLITVVAVNHMIVGYFVLSTLMCVLNIVYCYFVDGWMNPDHLFLPYNFS